jgi:hypothetical protein
MQASAWGNLERGVEEEGWGTAVIIEAIVKMEGSVRAVAS